MTQSLSTLTRRSALLAACGLGLSVSYVGRAMAADPALARRKLVVVVCRGAMDGLSVSPPGWPGGGMAMAPR